MVCLIPGWLIGIGYPELLKPAPGLERRDDPARLFPATGPGFLRSRRVTVFRQNFWISASWRPVGLLFGGGTLGLAPVELCETIFKFELFCTDFFREDLRELLMQEPELIKSMASRSNLRISSLFRLRFWSACLSAMVRR